jgi:hypothetical protein
MKETNKNGTNKNVIKNMSKDGIKNTNKNAKKYKNEKRKIKSMFKKYR